MRFPLQAVLLVRSALERQAEMRLSEANRAVAEARARVDEVECLLQQLSEDVLEQARSGTTAAELQFAALCREQTRRQALALREVLQERQSAQAQAAEAFVEARRGREAIETLRQQHWQKFQLEEKRSDQRRADDAFLMRRTRPGKPRD